MSVPSDIILSNRGKISVGWIIRSLFSAVILSGVGILMLLTYDTLDYGYNERFMPYLILVCGILFLAFGIFILLQSIMIQRSFLELTVSGVCGASIKLKGRGLNASLTPPRLFSLPYAEIQRADIEKGFILLVAGPVTYRCRASGMEQDFLQALNQRLGKKN